MFRSASTKCRLLGLLALLAVVPVHAVEVQGFRLWEGPEKTRAVLDISADADYRLFTLEGPHRVVIDIRNAELGAGLELPDLGSGLIRDFRSGRRNRDDLRIVLDLDRSVRPKSFLLKPAEQYGHRLVVDLFAEGQGTPQAPKTLKAERNRDVVIAVDAGHGGEDPGAIGPSGAREKDVTLAIAREVVRLLDSEPGMEGLLVRSGDYYIPHLDRPRLARERRADLFISIHADAFRDRRVRGSGVFVLSPRRASSEAARWLARSENRADLVGGVKLNDKDETLAAVLLDLSQSASMQASEDVASQILASLGRVGPTHKDHVESAPFAVLTSPDIPSVLIETAFISNPEEERRLKSVAGRKRVARAIVDGIRGYFYQTPPPGTWLAMNRSDGEHIVARGETLSGIAVRHRVSLARLKAANNLNGDLVRAGDVLRIPALSP